MNCGSALCKLNGLGKLCNSLGLGVVISSKVASGSHTAHSMPCTREADHRPFPIAYNQTCIVDSSLKNKKKRIRGRSCEGGFESTAKHLIEPRSSTEVFSLLPEPLISWLQGFLGGSRWGPVWW